MTPTPPETVFALAEALRVPLAGVGEMPLVEFYGWLSFFESRGRR